MKCWYEVQNTAFHSFPALHQVVGSPEVKLSENVSSFGTVKQLWNEAEGTGYK